MREKQLVDDRDLSAKVDRALAPLRAGLEADKVALVPDTVADGGKTLVLRLETSPESCADCFVSPDVMEAMVLEALIEEGAPYEAVIVRADPAAAHQ